MYSNIVVIAASGGVVHDVYSNLDLRIILVDWDNIEDGDEPGELSLSPLSEMDETLLEQVEKAVL